MDEGAPVTILFTDVEGSTDLRTRRGDASAHEILREHEQLVRACVGDFGGREVKALGDGFMVVFASVRRALGCAIAIQQVVEEALWKTPERAVRVRIGVNTGEVVDEDGDLYGQAVNAAARIAARAQAGEILVSEVTRQLAGSGPELVFRDRGRVRLKGFPDRWHLYALAWESTERPAPAPAGRTPYVGRKAEREQLARALDSARAGKGRLVLIGGEPGVGKTRLAEELTAHAQAAGVLVLTGHSYEMDGAAPYVAFVEILEAALEEAPSPQVFCQALGQDAPEVAKLLPRLRRLCPDIPPPLELPAEQERRLLFNSIRNVIIHLAEERPLLVALDDLQWADDSTLLLVEHLAERLGESYVLLVATYRATDVDAGRPLGSTFEALRRRHLAEWMPLRPLSEEAVAELVAALSGEQPPPGLVRALFSETDGNPFFVEEVYRYLAEEGRLLDADGHLRGDLEIGELDVPDGVRLVVGRRLQRLGERSQRILAAAAVAGRAFSVELLEAMEEWDPDTLLDAVEAGVRARLVVAAPDPSGEDRFLFSHELVRQTLVADLSLTRRRRLHVRVADAIERHYGPALDQQAAVIAHHLAEGGPAVDPNRLLGYRILAGRAAMETAGYEDALRHLEGALSQRELAQPQQLAGVFFDVGLARAAVGLIDEALSAFDEALVAHEGLGDPEGKAEVAFKASQVLWWINRDEEAFVLAERALEALGDRASPARARLLAWTGAAVGFVSPFEVGAKMIDEAIDLAETLEDEQVLGHALVAKACHRLPFSRYGEVVEAGRTGATLLRSAGQLWDAALVLGFVEFALTCLGRMQEAAIQGEEVLQVAERIGHSTALWVHNRVDAPREFASTPDLDRFETAARRDLELPGQEGYAYAWLATIALLRGDWDAALRLAHDAVAHDPANALTGWEWGALTEVRAYRGETTEALSVLTDKSELLPGGAQANGLGSWHFLLSTVEALCVLEQHDAAGRLYPSVREFLATGTVFDFLLGRLAERVAGMAAAAGSRWEDAEVHFGNALRLAQELPNVLEGAETRRFYAHMLLRRDADRDHEQANDLVSEAVETYRRIGMPRHQEMARALIAD